MKAHLILLWSLVAVGCFATVGEYDSGYGYVPPAFVEPVVSRSEPSTHPVLQELHGILDMPAAPEKSRAGLDWFRKGLDQMDARLQSVGIDPEQHAYENAYRQARDGGASPSEAHWEAQRDMRNMEIFRAGGIPPNF